MNRETSIEAYHHIKENGILSTRRWQVYDYLFHHGPCTAKEVARNLKEGAQGESGYHARLSELRNKGLVKECGTIICPASGQRVLLWDVTSLSDPIKPKKKATKVQILEAEIKRLKALLDLWHIDYRQNELPF